MSQGTVLSSVILAVAFGLGSPSTAPATNLTERWSGAQVGFYVPDDSGRSIIHGDVGTWLLGATVDGSPDCGPIPHEAEVTAAGAEKVLRLTSGESTEGCADNLWAVLFANRGAPVGNRLSIPITPAMILSFDERGALVDPQKHGWGNRCVAPPCYDNVSVQVEDTRGNVLAYVLQRYPEAQPVEDRDNYFEIHLDPEAGTYSRKLYDDFSLLPTFAPGSRISSVTLVVDEHGWATLSKLQLADTDAIPPVVTEFAVPRDSSSLTVAVAAFEGTDNVGVTGYLITESEEQPSSKSSKWSPSAPAVFTFPRGTTSGEKRLYAWTKDAEGNVSEPRPPAPVTLNLPVSDKKKPSVTSFGILSPATSRTLVITWLFATDDVGVTGYLVSNDKKAPSRANAAWAPTPPETFTLPSLVLPGKVTLYAWARDAAGRVSSPRSAKAVLTLPPSQLLVGTWEVTKIQGAPGKVDGSNSTWTFRGDGTYDWFLRYDPYYDLSDAGTYAFDGRDLTVDGEMGGIFSDGGPFPVTLKGNTLTLRDADGDRWTYRRTQ